jgi:L-2-hydroxycarboxylate dehydrogenase (NAD+)
VTVRLPAGRLRAFTTAAFVAAGLDPASAARTAELMNQADLQGSDGHGIIRLAPYIRRIREGGYNLKPDIRVVHEKAAMAVLDGDNAMGHLVMDRAAKLAIEKAKTAGIGWVGARYSNHAGPASLYARMALEHDMIGIYFAVGNANHLPPWGGLDMLLSTNPLAVAVPSSDVPIVLDMATTVAAYGKVKAKAQKGEMMPEGWMIDRFGNALLDPKRASEGFLLPIGGYKGYGLAVMVGLLAGTLNGAAMGKDTIDFNADFRTTTNTGQAMLAIDVAAFDDVAAFKGRVDKLASDLRAAEKMPNVDRIWLPGEQSYAKQQEFTKNGVPVADGVIATLAELAATLGIPPLDTTQAG